MTGSRQDAHRAWNIEQRDWTLGFCASTSYDFETEMLSRWCTVKSVSSADCWIDVDAFATTLNLELQNRVFSTLSSITVPF
jgi:hypothetical protein